MTEQQGADTAAATTEQAENPPDIAMLELPDALAAALAEAEALAQQKESRAAVARLTGAEDGGAFEDEADGAEVAPEPVAPAPRPAPAAAAPAAVSAPTGPGERSFGPAIRGMPVEDRATAAMRTQLEQLRRSLAEEQDARARAEQDAQQVRADLRATRQRFARASDQQVELQRRLDRAESELPARTTRRLLQGLLPALDSQHTVLQGLAADASLGDESRRALEMMRSDWQRALLSVGVTAFDAEGQRFDPAVHEAISSVAPPEGVKPGTVLRQVGRGYLLDGRLLRSAQVVVTNAEEGDA
ncbi:MAG: hypothetical protein RIT45_3800 [Pseudomonadota bacterium]|jgi:molecular chaperone GrpE